MYRLIYDGIELSMECYSTRIDAEQAAEYERMYYGGEVEVIKEGK